MSPNEKNMQTPLDWQDEIKPMTLDDLNASLWNVKRAHANPEPPLGVRTSYKKAPKRKAESDSTLISKGLSEQARQVLYNIN